MGGIVWHEAKEMAEAEGRQIILRLFGKTQRFGVVCMYVQYIKLQKRKIGMISPRSASFSID